MTAFDPVRCVDDEEPPPPKNDFDVRWPGGSCIDYLDMIEITETGLRPLSTLPRTLTVV